MTRVVIDSSRCRSYGLCVAIDPDVFAVPPGSPWGVVVREQVADDELEEVREAVRTCPANAISVVDES